MAILEEVSDDETPVLRPAVQSVRPADPPATAKTGSIPSVDVNMAPVNKAELQATLRVLSARLALPESLLTRFLNEDKDDRVVSAYRCRAHTAVQAVYDVISSDKGSQLWEDSSVEEQAEVWSVLGRLRGSDVWTNQDIRELVEAIPMTNTEDISLHILQHTIRPLFVHHPSLSTASRALPRPAGGAGAMTDMHDAASQPFKLASGWGVHNLLAFCASSLSAPTLLDKIGLVLPPTLVLMDDWESPWRLRGIRVLASWVEKVDTATMHRMGLGKLLVSSLIHTASMHGSHEVPDAEGLVVRTTMQLVWRLWEGQERMEKVEDVMEKGIIHGWTYSPSGEEGRLVGVKIARDLQAVIEYLGEGIIRWLKTIIPHLLQPLAFVPTPHSAALFSANLSALLDLLHAIAPTGRAARWRGVILDCIARLWVGLVEREKEDALFGSIGSTSAQAVDTKAWICELKEKVTILVKEVERQCPSVRQKEFAELVTIDKAMFTPLIAAQ